MPSTDDRLSRDLFAKFVSLLLLLVLVFSDGGSTCALRFVDCIVPSNEGLESAVEILDVFLVDCVEILFIVVGMHESYYLVAEGNVGLGKEAVGRTDSVELSHYLDLLVLLPLFDFAAAAMLDLIGDDVEGAMEQHAEVHSYSL